MIDVVLKEHLYREGDPDIGRLESAAQPALARDQAITRVTLSRLALMRLAPTSTVSLGDWRRGQLFLAQDLKEEYKIINGDIYII